MPKLRETLEQKERRRFNGWVYANMKMQDLAQKDLADCLDLPQPSISTRLHGKREWSLTEMTKLCELFNEQYVVGVMK